jgi:predicted dehydrogenase
VLLEKPMTLAASEADELVALAAQRERVLAVALNPPYWSHTRTAREAVTKGRIGRVESAALHWVGNVEAVFGRAPLPDDMPGVVRPTLYRGDAELSGGGHLLDTGSHLISEMLWVTGLSARTVSAQMDDPALDMRASVQVMLGGDTPCDVVCVGNSRHPDRRIRNQYFGSEGTLTIEGMPFRVTVEGPGAPPEGSGEGDLPEAPGPAADFLDAIRRGGPPASPGAHGADVVRVVEAAYRSARTGQREVL